MSTITALVDGQITQSPHDVLIVQLVEPDGMEAFVRIGWPEHPTICDPRRFAEIAAAAMKVLAAANIELASIRGRRKL